MIEHARPREAAEYSRIAAAIAYLQDHYTEQPTLAAVARRVGLSESRTQRLFTAWAGISPKRFVQHLTAVHTTTLLRQGRSVLDTAYAAGLSGPARLHDLMLNVHATTPGVVGSGGAALRIGWGVTGTPFGPALLAVTERGVCGMHFLEPMTDSEALDDVRRRWPAARFEPAPDAVRTTADAIFGGAHAAPVSVLVSGTNFQIQVWRALLRVPAGAVATYDDIAREIDAPRAHRAVGAAVGRNPIALLIPCHRVIRKSGELGGYHWGRSRKGALLAWESARREADASAAAALGDEGDA